jgi:hypothetical protein
VTRKIVEIREGDRLSADQGLAGAQFNLGIMYTEGKGVPQDHVLAHMWLDLVVSELPPSGKDQRNSIRVDDRAPPPSPTKKLCGNIALEVWDNHSFARIGITAVLHTWGSAEARRSAARRASRPAPDGTRRPP